MSQGMQAVTLKTEITQNDLVNLAVVEGYELLEQTATNLQQIITKLEKERQEKQAVVNRMIDKRVREACQDSIDRHNAIRKEIGFKGEDKVTEVTIDLEKHEVVVHRVIIDSENSYYGSKQIVEKTFDLVADELDRLDVISKLTETIGGHAQQLAAIRKKLKDIALLEMKARATVTRNTLALAGDEGKAIKECFEKTIHGIFPKQLVERIKENAE